ncbi:MAG: hypothetical protein J7M09_04430, partial [Deltaproteobacteria bacterium]|nr:hypothetical protein [Candidatus Tharpella sp.]
VLVLDEPTNHLDLESIETFIEALVKFEGTIIFVSHNRYLVNRLASRILELKSDGFDLYPGTYAEYLEHLGHDHLSGTAPTKSQSGPTRMRQTEGEKEKERKKEANKKPRSENNKPASKKRPSAKQQIQDKGQRKKLNNQLRPLKKESAAAEALCEELEKENENFNQLFLQSDYYAKTSPEIIKKQAAEKKECEEKLSWAYHKWEQLNQEIEALRKELEF